jgi:Right handed beta helix region
MAMSTPGATIPVVSSAPNASEPGEPLAEPPTFHSLGVRWPVRGDANANAWIAVQYIKRGDAEWKEALPLFRTNPEAVSPENRVPNGWLFAGSIVDLVPDTEYLVALSLRDPDGGDTRRILTMRTAVEPREPLGMRVRHVVSGAAAAHGPGTGTADDPFRGLKAAQARAEPGDLLLLHAGVYAEGTWTVDRFGTPERPIIYRGAGDGETILDGGGAERLVSANGVRHVWFERLTFRNAPFLFVGHSGSHFVVRRCRFEVIQAGITAINGGYIESRGFVITDNVFRGSTSWPRSSGIEDINGIIITGAGHVVAYNRMTNLADGIHGTEHGRLSATDIYGNDIEVATDDGIETDNSDTNVRVFRNRITNAFSGVSAQPSNGGPVYVFRNAIYNVEYSPFKLHNDTSGVLIFHNTSVKAGIPFLIDPAGETVSDVITRNNLFIGTSGPALFSTGRMIRCGFDSDGYGWLRSLGLLQALIGGFAQWNGEVYLSPDAAKRAGRLYWERGAIVMPSGGNFASGLRPPGDHRVHYPSSGTDLRLAGASRAVDVGVRVPNFNDGFRGSAPDLGCCELDEPLPHYGPRP